MNIIDEAKNCIQEKSILRAIQIIDDLIVSSEHADGFNNDLIVLTSRFKKNERDLAKGIIDRSYFDLTDNQIAYGLLDLLDRIKEIGYKKSDAKKRFGRIISVNPTFQGRIEILENVHQILLNKKSVLLSGISGIGKSQIARQYMEMHQNSYDSFIWLNASTENNLTSSITKINAQGKYDYNPNRSHIEIFISWLEFKNNYLLVVDDVSDFSIVYKLVSLAESNSGKLIFTSNIKRPLAYFRDKTIYVKKLNHHDSVQLLLNSSDKEKVISSNEKDSAIRICKELDGIPLALFQVGTYIAKSEISFLEFEKIFKEIPENILDWREFENYDGYTQSIAKVWNMKIGNIISKDSSVKKLLDYISVCESSSVSNVFISNVLLRCLNKSEDNISQVDIHQILMKLIDNSIIESNDQNYFIHPLLSRIYRFKLSDTEILSILESYFEVFQETFPNPNSTLLNECDFFSPHVLQMTTFLESHKDVFKIGKYLYFFKNFLYYLFLRKNYSPMDKVFRLVTRLAKPESEDLGIIFISMAKIYEELDMLPRAKLLLNEAKSIVNKYDKLTEKGRFLWGMYVEAEGHIAEAENHNIKKALNKLNEAISLLERDKFALTNEYASMLNCYGNLLLKDKQFLLAKNAYEKTLLIRELNSNKKTYEIASSYNNIGLCLLNLGNIKESRIYLAKALVVFKELLGEYHLDIAIVYYNLGLLFYRKKNNLRSMVYLEKAVEILSILEKAAFDDEQSRWEILSRKKMEVLKSYLAVAHELKEYDKIVLYEEAFLKHISKSKWEAFNLLGYIAFIAQAHEGRNDIKNAIKAYNEIVDYLLLFDIEKTDLIIAYRIKLVELFFLKTNNIKEATKIYNQIVEMGRGNLEKNDYETVLKSIEMILYG